MGDAGFPCFAARAEALLSELAKVLPALKDAT
jgi:hypothetical protein